MSKVYAITLRASDKESLLAKLTRLLEAVGLEDGIAKRDLTAIKLHFGEKGNTSFIRPILVRPVVDAVKKCGGDPFLTDANTLYVGRRSNAAHHLQTAIENGFGFSVVGAPSTIADGLKGTSYKAVEYNGENVKTAYVGADLAEADVLISLAHFKLHELTGVGGAIKNIGMGGAARRGKMDQHSGISPKVKNKKCIACGDCLTHCQQLAIAFKEVDDKKKAYIDPKKCVGCAECVRVCPQEAIQVQFSKSIPDLMKKMVEYTDATLIGKKDKSFHINFITQVSPACDCHPMADAPIVRDIGILASKDPVAVDKASTDLINQEPGLPGCCLKALDPGEDKVRAVYKYIDWELQFEHAEKIGLGSQTYDLEWLPEKE